MIGPRMRSIQWAVTRYPGQTAHALAALVYGQRRPRWGYVYEAFSRAESAGLILRVRDGALTRYIPAGPR